MQRLVTVLLVAAAAEESELQKHSLDSKPKAVHHGNRIGSDLKIIDLASMLVVYCKFQRAVDKF